jgi:ubiquinone/menaquinone biosynthesis C-methylase UbiE
MTINYGAGGLEQGRVQRYFESGATFWDTVYEGSDVFARIHQHRLGAALASVDSLRLPAGTRVLDAGAGAGLAAVELARRGFIVDAVDPAQAMVDLLTTRARQVGLEGQVSTHRGDVHALDFEAGSFKVALALGVIPWLHSPELALRELSRVLEPGGWLIVNADNRSRLNRLLDPWSYPGVTSLRSVGKAALGKLRQRPLSAPAPTARMHSHRQFDRMLTDAGMIKIDSTSFGYGPFTLLGRGILPPALGIRLNARLQDLSDSGLAPLGGLGAQYLVLARKSGGSRL